MDPLQMEARSFAIVRNPHGLPPQIMLGHEESYRAMIARVNQMSDDLPRTPRTTSHPLGSEWRSAMLDRHALVAGIRNYEVFLSRLGTPGGRPSGPLLQRLQADFGSYEAFLADWRASAVASRGWVALVFDREARLLTLQIADSPEQLGAWHQTPLVVMEVSAGASLTSLRARERHFDSFVDHVDWNLVARTLEDELELLEITASA